MYFDTENITENVIWSEKQKYRVPFHCDPQIVWCAPSSFESTRRISTNRASIWERLAKYERETYLIYWIVKEASGFSNPVQ
jgi:hypothetical protein